MTRRASPNQHLPTPHELIALRAVAIHGTVKAAAEALVLSPHTIDNQLDRLRERTGLHHLPQLIFFACEQGWVRTIPFE